MTISADINTQLAQINKFKIGRSRQRQSGIVMIVTLIALAILLLASVALIRSTDANLLIAGHLSFKRDIVNRAERAIPIVRAAFNSGSLSTSLARQSDIPAANYYATILTSNASGIPNILLDTAVFDAALPSNNIVDTAGQTTIRYVIDRMCLATGPISSTSCSLSSSNTDPSGNPDPKMIGATRSLYRISMRVTGPRNTEAFLQTTVTF
ncbi:MAG TPA: hypothetical protein VK974_01670 [Methylophilaceae bacterium]|nr:hypothetical protein [Methylophilaceae bacterium]